MIMFRTAISSVSRKVERPTKLFVELKPITVQIILVSQTREGDLYKYASQETKKLWKITGCCVGGRGIPRALRPIASLVIAAVFF